MAALTTDAADLGATGTPDVAAWVRDVHHRLIDERLPESPAEQIDLLRALADLTAGIAAVQGAVSLTVDRATRDAEATRGVPEDQRGRAVPMQIALALRESPARARALLGAARVWHTEMPHTLEALRVGHVSPWRAMVLVKETAHLPLEQRVRIDSELCADPAGLAGVGSRAFLARVRRRAAELDPAAAAQRARRAESERAVWIRPAPDTMAYVTALLPVAQGVAVYARLRRAADAARAAGDERSLGQVMADTLVQRVTGQPTPQAVPTFVNLVLSDATLLAGGHEPGVVLDDTGGGQIPVPAEVARHLVAHGLDADAAWLRRIYADGAGRLVGASSSQRFFADGLAALLRVRDQGLCRTPYCDAPVRHLDHVIAAADRGATELDNGQGLCAACNLAKQAPGWQQHALPRTTGRHTVVTTTPTGHRYRSTAPRPPRPVPV